MNNRARMALLCLPAFLLPVAAVADEMADRAAIRKVMMATWDMPEARLEVDPIVVVSDRSIAGWTQGAHGGRALLARTAEGRWHVVACAGDGLLEVRTLEMTGVSASLARALASALVTAESSLPASRRAKFSTFDGMVRMDGGKAR